MTSRDQKKIPMGKSDMKKRFRALPGPQNLHFDDFLIIFVTFPKMSKSDDFYTKIRKKIRGISW